MSGRVLLGTVLLCGAAMSGLGFVHPFGNPRKDMGGVAAEDRGQLLNNAQIPADAKAILIAKCADCHSDATRWPAYARIAPGSWLIERDVIQGRRHMNLSKWAELTPDDRQIMEAKIIQQTRNGQMPPIQYRLIHWDAALSAEDLRVLSKLGKEGSAVEGVAAGVGDAERGKAVFNKRCTSCHALEVNREGPKLRGIYGQKAAQVAGFKYSAALKASGIIWDEASLDRWLSDTDAMIQDNAMGFRVVKASERRDLIAYLKQMK